MGKRQKLKSQVASAKVAAAEAVPAVGLKIGTYQLRPFDGADAAFGARLQDYPPMSAVPDGLGAYERVMSSLFFLGGQLADHGLTIKAGLDRAQVMTAIRSLMCSFDPKHEHKTAVVAWALSEWCDGIPKAA
jgi:hypothetical protein